MNVLSWGLALSFLILAVIQAVSFHKGTVCRQEAWLLAFELRTKSLLSRKDDSTRGFHARCGILSVKKDQSVFWQRLPDLKKHEFSIPLRGRL